MKKIKLTQGKYTLIDDCDLEKVNKYKWRFHLDGYAIRSKRPQILMHRFILNPPKNMDIDHKNMNGLDNRRINIRIATRSQNKLNMNKRIDNTSGHKGISWDKKNKKWLAYTKINGKFLNFGRFSDKQIAIHIYENNVSLLHGDYLRI